MIFDSYYEKTVAVLERIRTTQREKIAQAAAMAQRTIEAGGIIWGDVPVYLVGVAVAAGSGYACIRLLKMIAAKGKFGAFAYYCWAVGVFTLALALIRG